MEKRYCPIKGRIRSKKQMLKESKDSKIFHRIVPRLLRNLGLESSDHKGEQNLHTWLCIFNKLWKDRCIVLDTGTVAILTYPFSGTNWDAYWYLGELNSSLVDLSCPLYGQIEVFNRCIVVACYNLILCILFPMLLIFFM